jgi:hypothetical protein
MTAGTQATIADQRILRGPPATLQATFSDSVGSAADPAGPVTVTVTTAPGATLLAAAPASLTGSGSGDVTVALTAAQTASLGLLTAVWTDEASGSTVTSHHEIVGGFFFSLAQARASDDTLANTGKYPDATILAKRLEVEGECEYICDLAFVPRYRYVVLDGTGTTEILLPDNEVRTILSATVTVNAGTSSPTSTPLSAADLASLAYDDSLVARTNFQSWDIGQGNIAVEYLHGLDIPPADLQDATLLRLRSRLNLRKSGTPDRATSFTSAADGGTYRLDLPSRYKTGIPDVDATYARWSRRSTDANGPVAASRTLHFDANRSSLYHSGRH